MNNMVGVAQILLRKLQPAAMASCEYNDIVQHRARNRYDRTTIDIMNRVQLYRFKGLCGARSGSPQQGVGRAKLRSPYSSYIILVAMFDHQWGEPP